jgi:hypothetical protein
MRAREALSPGFHLNLLLNDSQLLAAFEMLIEQRKSSSDTESVDRALLGEATQIFLGLAENATRLQTKMWGKP